MEAPMDAGTVVCLIYATYVHLNVSSKTQVSRLVQSNNVTVTGYGAFFSTSIKQVLLLMTAPKFAHRLHMRLTEKLSS